MVEYSLYYGRVSSLKQFHYTQTIFTTCVGNEQLARSGSNCLENLIVSTGKQFFPDMWDRVCECISDIFTGSLPTELLTWKPPERLYRTQSNASLASSFSSISEAQLPSNGRPVSVASVSTIETAMAYDDTTEVVATEAPITPEITVVPSSPPKSKELEDNETVSGAGDTVSSTATAGIQENTAPNEPPLSNVINNVPNDGAGNVSGDVVNDVLNNKTAVTNDMLSDSPALQQQVTVDPVTDKTVENAPLLNEEMDHHPLSHAIQQHHVHASSGKPPSTKKQKEKRHKGAGSFLQRRKRGSTGSTAGKKSNVTNNTETGNRKESVVKKNHKLSHLQSPDADLAKSKFNKIGEVLS